MKPAHATFYVFYSASTAGPYTALPGSPAADGSTITINGGSAGGITTITSSFTNNAPNSSSSTPSFTNSTQINATSTTGGTLTFAIIEDNFRGPTSGPFMLSNAVTIIPNLPSTGSSVSQTSCVVASGGPAPTAANAGTLCGSALAITAPASSTLAGGPASQSSTTTAMLSSVTTPFTTVEYFTLTLTAGANVLAQGSTTLLPVPEPMSIALIGSGLIGLGLVRRKRQGV